MRAAQRLLVRAWRRDARGWWALTAALLAAILLVVVGVAGLLEGMNRATESRIADFYTGDLRITDGRPAAAPQGAFDLDNETVQAAIAAVDQTGGTLEPRIETTYLLSRRSFVEAYLFEDEQFEFAVPGGAGGGQQFTAGILVGLVPDGHGFDRVQEHVVTGRVPATFEANASLELLMSAQAFREMLADGEAARFASWPPSASELATVRFEITAGHIDESGANKDVYRSPARVVGLYESRIEALDRVTVITTMANAQSLLGIDPASGEFNVLVAYGGTAAAQREANAADWHTEGANHFAHRYLGQLVDVVRILTLAISLLLLAFPVFLLWYGMAQQLERSQRELTVCRAIGLPRATLGQALARLAAGVLAWATLPVVAFVGLGLVLLPDALARWSGFPLPVTFVVPLWVAFAAGLSVLMGAGLAVAGALHRHVGRDIASTLRAA